MARTRDAIGETRTERKARVAAEKEAARLKLEEAEAAAQQAEEDAQAAEDSAQEDRGEETKKAAEEAEARKAAAHQAEAEAEAAIKKLTDEEAQQAEEDAKLGVVVVVVPKKYNLRLDNDRVITYHAGVQDMDRAHAEHWYSKANGVKIHGE